MNVWVVISWIGEETTVRAVFSTEEKARTYIASTARHSYYGWDCEEHTLDEVP